MIVQYHKLERLLKDKKIRKTKFYRDLKLSQSEIAKLRSHRVLSLDSYIKIASYLECDISDFMEVISSASTSKEIAIDPALLSVNSYKTPFDRLP